MASDRSMIGGAGVLRFPDGDTLADLATFVGRAARVDPGGAVRLVGYGDILAVYVSPVHGGGGPVVLGLRTVRLATASAIDVTVPIEALQAALAAEGADVGASADVGGSADVGAPDGASTLAVPAGGSVTVAWAGTTPPRRGWQPVGAIDSGVLWDRARAGIAEIAEIARSGAGAAAVATLRARVWGRPLLPDRPELEGLPTGVAFAALALGFTGREPAAVHRAGPWWRLTMVHGHVAARRPTLV